jgi:hypothetical protein
MPGKDKPINSILLLLLAVGCESIIGLERSPPSDAESAEPVAGDAGQDNAVAAGGTFRASKGTSGGRGSSVASGGSSAGAVEARAAAGEGIAGATSPSAGAPANAGNGAAPAFVAGEAGVGGAKDGGAENGGAAAFSGAAGGAGGTGDPAAERAGGGGTAPSTGGGGPGRGSLVSVDHLCVTASSTLGVTPTRPELAVCDGSPAQYWQRDSAGRLFAAIDAAFLQVDGDREGSPLTVASATDSLNQKWDFENVHLVNRSGLCLDMPYGDFADHIRAQLAPCHWDPPQAWTLPPNGTVSHRGAGEGPPGHCLDVYGNFTNDGVPVQAFGCNGGENQRFSFEDGLLQRAGKCVAAFGDGPRDGAPLEMQTCRSPGDPERAEQQFYVEGAIQSLGACLAMGDASSTLRVTACDDSEQQLWRWYF